MGGNGPRGATRPVASPDSLLHGAWLALGSIARLGCTLSGPTTQHVRFSPGNVCWDGDSVYAGRSTPPNFVRKRRKSGLNVQRNQRREAYRNRAIELPRPGNGVSAARLRPGKKKRGRRTPSAWERIVNGVRKRLGPGAIQRTTCTSEWRVGARTTPRGRANGG